MRSVTGARSTSGEPYRLTEIRYHSSNQNVKDKTGFFWDERAGGKDEIFVQAGERQNPDPAKAHRLKPVPRCGRLGPRKKGTRAESLWHRKKPQTTPRIRAARADHSRALHTKARKSPTLTNRAWGTRKSKAAGIR